MDLKTIIELAEEMQLMYDNGDDYREFEATIGENRLFIISNAMDDRGKILINGCEHTFRDVSPYEPKSVIAEEILAQIERKLHERS